MKYRILTFAVLATSSGGLDYENQFRLQSMDSSVILGFPSRDIYGNYLGIYDRTDALDVNTCSLGNDTCYWGTSIAFAPPCDWPAGNTEAIDFYDVDSDPGNYQSVRNIGYNVLRYPRDGTGGPVSIASGVLTGSQNANVSISGLSFDPGYSYELQLGNIYIRNSLQIRLPWQQVNSLYTCNPPPPGSGVIQGYRVPNIDPVWNADILADGTYPPDVIDATHAYYYTNVGAGRHGISVTPPAGWVVAGSTLCYDSTGCHTLSDPSFQGGAYRDVDIVNGRTADLWWHFDVAPGFILGRIYKDDNANSVFDGGSEVIMQYPPGACAGYGSVPHTIDVIGFAQTVVNRCNSDPYYQVDNVPPGSYTVQLLNLPPGWEVTTPPQVTDVPSGADGQPNPWFGARIKAPVFTSSCVNGVIKADVNWFDAGLGPTDYAIDIDNDADFGNGFYNRWAPWGTTNINDVPNGFNGVFGQSGPLVLAPSTTYWARVWYQSPYGWHSAVTTFTTAPMCWAFQVVNPTAVVYGLLPNDEAPTSATFDTRFGVQYTPNGPLPSGVNLSTTRQYYVIRASAPGVKVPIVPGPGPTNPDSRLFPISAPKNNGEIYIESRPLPAVTYGDKICAEISINPGSGQVDSAGNVTFPGPAVSTPVAGCATITAKPYFKVFAGDVVAGAGTACPGWFPAGVSGTNPQPGNIQAWSNGSGSGAGNQLLVQALDVIRGFSSAQSRSLIPKPDKGLSFSNTAGDATYGGSFGAVNCPPDFWQEATKLPTTSSVSTYTIPAAPFNGSFLYVPVGGNLDLSASGGLIRKGKILVLYVDGDVTIKNSITYEGAAAGWASLDDIPSLTIIAHGDIYIDQSVDRIDGTLIAQPKDATNGGTIYTCSIGHNKPTQDDLASNAGACKTNKLTIIGSVLARTIKLYRSSNSLKDAAGDAVNNGLNVDYTTNSAAERFIYSPEGWVRNNGVRSGNNLGEFDAVTSLPPVL